MPSFQPMLIHCQLYTKTSAHCDSVLPYHFIKLGQRWLKLCSVLPNHLSTLPRWVKSQFGWVKKLSYHINCMCYLSPYFQNGHSDECHKKFRQNTVMACCLTTPSHHMFQCCIIITEILLQSSEGRITGCDQDISYCSLDLTHRYVMDFV